MIRVLWVLCVFVVFLCGCGGVKPRTVEVPQAKAVEEAKAILKSYADGQQVASEIESFPQIISRLREEDASKADIVDDAVKKISSNPRNAKSIAAETLKKLN